jgi:mono/diheme cytochrome c family protein
MSVLTLLTAAPSAFAADGDASNGEKIAQERCATCHNTDKGGAFKLYPPSFQAIAIYRTKDDIWGRIVAPSPHRGMPNAAWTLSPDDVQDLLAYIVSLDRPITVPQ